MSNDITTFCECSGKWQKKAFGQKYSSALQKAGSSLFSTFSMNLASPLSETNARNKNISVGVPHLSGWPVVRATQQETAVVPVELVRVALVEHSGAPQSVVTDNGS